MNLSYRHLIFCRFAMDYDPSIDWTCGEVYQKYLSVARRGIIATLENQTDKGFTLIFLTQHDTEENIALLKALSSQFPIEVINPDKAKVLTPERLGGAEIIITSRLDYDDYVDRECVAHIHNLIKTNPKILLYGIETGATYDSQEQIPHLFSTPRYGLQTTGLHAPMLTLIYNIHYMQRLITVLDLGQHAKCVENLNKMQGQLLRWPINTKEITILDYMNSLGFLWVRHPLSFTYKNGFHHNTDIRIALTPQELTHHFSMETHNNP